MRRSNVHEANRETCYRLHQDVKPENVLVVSSEQTVPYKWRFKLGDLGLSQFERLTNLKRRPAIDTQGTRTYGMLM